ncbi:ABC transporter permease [Oricola sp.]|uniref:ABC transporter permease n=1 Tax=Oricola sp. TaxID=1979950 RepID=UPI003BAA1F03
MSVFDFLHTLLTVSFFAAILRAATPMVFAALGGLISELAGVINVALEGMMLIAAFAGVVGSAWAAVLWPDAGPLFFALFGAALGLFAAVFLALVLAVFYLEFDANLIIAGIGINILAAGLTVFLLFTISGDKGSSAGLTSYALPSIAPGFLGDLPVIGALLAGANGDGHHILIYAALLSIVLVWLFLHKTRLGLHLRAVGENPEACRTAGLPVKRIQYYAILLSGLLAGLGGIYLSMGYLTLFQSNMTAGRGFLALAAIFLGARSVLGTAGAAAFFGLASVFAAQLGLLGVPTPVVFAVAPVLTIIALLLFSWVTGRREKTAISRALQALRKSKGQEHA